MPERVFLLRFDQPPQLQRVDALIGHRFWGKALADGKGIEVKLGAIGGKEVVLGLVTSKKPELEAAADLVARIKEASQYVSLDDLALSTQCGFASTEEGNQLTEDQQWAKIKLGVEVAKQVWG